MVRRPIVYGASVLLCAAVFLCLTSMCFICEADPVPVPPFLPRGATPERVIIEIAGSVTNDGIYELASPAYLDDLFRTAGLDALDRCDETCSDVPLTTGERVIVSRIPGGLDVEIGRMEPVTLVALGIPLSIQRATTEELLLVPGIGEKTAAAILQLRKEKGGFSSIDELGGIKGIGKRKLENIKRYFCL
ncbi:MAG: helix-hairpin-helix domain-containing protein [Deltaproteobacteria bacterium]|nr:helix-hairpin-helix domain-containing protein [Deltaproteobacteria bacterium]